MLYGCCVNLLPKTLDRIGLEYAGRLSGWATTTLSCP